MNWRLEDGTIDGLRCTVLHLPAEMVKDARDYDYAITSAITSAMRHQYAKTMQGGESPMDLVYRATMHPDVAKGVMVETPPRALTRYEARGFWQIDGCSVQFNIDDSETFDGLDAYKVYVITGRPIIKWDERRNAE